MRHFWWFSPTVQQHKFENSLKSVWYDIDTITSFSRYEELSYSLDKRTDSLASTDEYFCKFLI